METSVEFDSALFKPFLPDDRQVNPGRFGAELSFWLSRKLAERGLPTSYPNYEDWGWFIEFSNERGEEYWLCCSNMDGADDKWRCFLDPKARGAFGRHRASVEGAQPLLRMVRVVLEAETAIQNVVWSAAR
jgi:hypothetical protein